MKKSYGKIAYEITKFDSFTADILTMSSDRENAYVDSGGIWKPFNPGDYDDD